jgi:hypothetical protein
MTTKQFTPNKWMIFDVEGGTAIGRTFITRQIEREDIRKGF